MRIYVESDIVVVVCGGGSCIIIIIIIVFVIFMLGIDHSIKFYARTGLAGPERK